MAVNTAIIVFRCMKIYQLIESESESADREAVVVQGLYRGVDGAVSPGISKVTIRQDREPRDAELQEHIMFSALFEKVHGISDVRSRALFCTTDYDIALDYGNSVVSVYPLKSAKLAYMPGCADSGSILASAYLNFRHRLAIEMNVEQHRVSDVLAVNYESSRGFLESESPINCTAQVKQFIECLDEHAPGLSAKMLDVFNSLTHFVENYVIIPATQLSSIPDNVEVMVLESQYYYAHLTPNDE